MSSDFVSFKTRESLINFLFWHVVLMIGRISLLVTGARYENLASACTVGSRHVEMRSL